MPGCPSTVQDRLPVAHKAALLAGLPGPVESAGDEPRASVVGEVGPSPLEENDEPVAEPDQEEDVDEEPGQPGEQAREPDPVQVGDARGAADRGQRALVLVA